MNYILILGTDSETQTDNSLNQLDINLRQLVLKQSSKIQNLERQLSIAKKSIINQRKTIIKQKSELMQAKKSKKQTTVKLTKDMQQQRLIQSYRSYQKTVFREKQKLLNLGKETYDLADSLVAAMETFTTKLLSLQSELDGLSSTVPTFTMINGSSGNENSSTSFFQELSRSTCDLQQTKLQIEGRMGNLKTVIAKLRKSLEDLPVETKLPISELSNFLKIQPERFGENNCL